MAHVPGGDGRKYGTLVVSYVMPVRNVSVCPSGTHRHHRESSCVNGDPDDVKAEA